MKKLKSLLFIAPFIFISDKGTKPLPRPQRQFKEANEFSCEVPLKWLAMQLEIIKSPPSKIFLDPSVLAYCGVSLYEAVVNGMPAYQTLTGQLADMPEMPKTLPGASYHWATCANAALAFITRSFLVNATNANKISIDSLEKALNETFMKDVDGATLHRSVEYGKEVARLIFEWSKTDGSLAVNPPYVPPKGEGLWAPTPPDFSNAAVPYKGKNRLMVTGSEDGTDQPKPPAYSTEPSSDYYKMVKEVYDISQHLTAADSATAMYYRDNPGYPAGGHYFSTLSQVFSQAKPTLDMAALAYARAGIALNDAIIICYKAKYKYNVERPIRYIREVLGHPTWLALFNTPAHPEFPAGHAFTSAAVMEMLTSVFGDHFHFIDHTYDFLGMAPREFNSLNDLATDAAISRIYAGVHYRWSIEKGNKWGKAVAENILAKVMFLRE